MACGDFTPFSGRKNSPGWIEDEGGCHIWTGKRKRRKSGARSYGVVVIGGKERLVHRVRYEREVGPIPDGLVLDHFACNNGPGGCCNPAHVRPVEQRENVLRGKGVAARHRAKTHCHAGHPLTPDNIVTSYIEKYNWRCCRICARARTKQSARRKARREGRTIRVANKDKTHCNHGHPLSGDNLVIRSGARRCRTCERRKRRHKTS